MSAWQCLIEVATRYLLASRTLDSLTACFVEFLHINTMYVLIVCVLLIVHACGCMYVCVCVQTGAAVCDWCHQTWRQDSQAEDEDAGHTQEVL